MYVYYKYDHFAVGIGDIPRGSYLLLYKNLTNISVIFYWQLSDVLISLLDSGFITGSRNSNKVSYQ